MIIVMVVFVVVVMKVTVAMMMVVIAMERGNKGLIASSLIVTAVVEVNLSYGGDDGDGGDGDDGDGVEKALKTPGPSLELQCLQFSLSQDGGG